MPLNQVAHTTTLDLSAFAAPTVRYSTRQSLMISPFSSGKSPMFPNSGGSGSGRAASSGAGTLWAGAGAEAGSSPALGATATGAGASGGHSGARAGRGASDEQAEHANTSGNSAATRPLTA